MTTKLTEYLYEITTPGDQTIRFPAFGQEIRSSCPATTSCKLHCWDSKDLLCLHMDLRGDSPASLRTSYTREAVVLVFMLDGKLEGMDAGNTWKAQLRNGEHNIYRADTLEQDLELKTGSSSFKMLSVLLPLDDFRELLQPGYDSHNNLIQKLEDKQSGFLLDENLPILPALLQLLENLSHPPADPVLQYLFFRSSVLEILMQQLDQVERSFCRQFRDDCEMARMKPLLQARQILEEELINPPRIPELAKRVGTNEYDLKRNFKKTWGHTVFGYVTELRMQKALKLLKEEGKTVSETAHVVGYKNPQHFTVAFKKRFGILPSSLR